MNTSGTGRIGVTFDRDGVPTLHTKQYVGALTLPSGPHLDILPKAGNVDLLGVLRYAYGQGLEPVESTTRLQEGSTFLDILAYLFLDALRSVLLQGLAARYRELEETTRHLQGRWNLTREIQQQRHHLPTFESDHAQHTHDHVLNQALLRATHLLSHLASDPDLRGRLAKHRALLRKRVTHRRVGAHELDEINLTRLIRHYEPALEIARLVLQDLHIDDLRHGTHPSYTLLANMNGIFEQATERAARQTLGIRPGCQVQGQATSSNLLHGTPRIRLRPDVLVKERGDPVLVADAKWKVRDKPSNSDVYQIVSYMLAHECDGALLYPAQGGRLETSYTVQGGRRLRVVEVPLEDMEEMEKVFSEICGEAFSRRELQ